jgi:hypothetical protein
VLFFLVTNFAHWWFFGMYAHTVAGLIECYVQALPFFRYTLTGDGLFAGMFFGAYAAQRAWLAAASPQHKLAKT